MSKRALVTGITGQRLVPYGALAGEGIRGLRRHPALVNVQYRSHRSSLSGPARGGHALTPDLRDLNDSSSLNTILRQTQPDEIYNLGAQSHVRVSFDVPEYTGEVTGLGTVRLLEAIREVGIRPKFYQASSSEVFGKAVEVPQNEGTPFHPRSPYGCAKA